jgi:hypothetical protein
MDYSVVSEKTELVGDHWTITWLLSWTPIQAGDYEIAGRMHKRDDTSGWLAFSLFNFSNSIVRRVVRVLAPKANSNITYSNDEDVLEGWFVCLVFAVSHP